MTQIWKMSRSELKCNEQLLFQVATVYAWTLRGCLIESLHFKIHHIAEKIWILLLSDFGWNKHILSGFQYPTIHCRHFSSCQHIKWPRSSIFIHTTGVWLINENSQLIIFDHSWKYGLPGDLQLDKGHTKAPLMFFHMRPIGDTSLWATSSFKR